MPTTTHCLQSWCQFHQRLLRRSFCEHTSQNDTDDFFTHVSYYDAARLAHVSGLETHIGSFLEKDFYCSISFSNEIKKTLHDDLTVLLAFGICTHKSFVQTYLSSDCKY